MIYISLDADYQHLVKNLRGQFPAPSHADQIIAEDTQLICPDGFVRAVLLHDVIPRALWRAAYKQWRRTNKLPRKRVSAMGTRSMVSSISKDGLLSPRSGVNEDVLKVSPARHDWLVRNGEHPSWLNENKKLVKLVNSLYAEAALPLYEAQRRAVRSIRDRRLWHTVFTTIYLAKNFRTAYHTDSGNLPGAFTAIMPMGEFTGGELVLPRWRVAIAYQPGDLLLFDPQQLHGNLPFEGERLSAAFYCAALN